MTCTHHKNKTGKTKPRLEVKHELAGLILRFYKAHQFCNVQASIFPRPTIQEHKEKMVN